MSSMDGRFLLLMAGYVMGGLDDVVPLSEWETDDLETLHDLIGFELRDRHYAELDEMEFDS